MRRDAVHAYERMLIERNAAEENGDSVIEIDRLKGRGKWHFHQKRNSTNGGCGVAPLPHGPQYLLTTSPLRTAIY